MIIFFSKAVTDSDNGDDSDEETPAGQNDKSLSTTSKRPKQRKVQTNRTKSTFKDADFSFRHTIQKFYRSISMMIRQNQWLHFRITY